MSSGMSGLEDDAWRGFLLTHDRLWRTIEATMAPVNVSMSEYSVLAILGEARPAGVRMSDIASRQLMSSGGFTRLADRLETRCLIERRRSEADGRSFEAVITHDGLGLLRRAWKRQHAELRTHFFDRLDERDLSDLARIWTKLEPEQDPNA